MRPLWLANTFSVLAVRQESKGIAKLNKTSEAASPKQRQNSAVQQAGAEGKPTPGLAPASLTPQRTFLLFLCGAGPGLCPLWENQP